MDALALFDDDLAVASEATPVTPAEGIPVARPAADRRPAPQGPVVLAVDGNSLAHRGYHAYAARRGDGDLVGAGLYGFLALLAAVTDIVRPQSVVVGMDCRVTSIRKDEWPAYKGQRPDKPDALDALLDEIPVALRELGAHVVTHEGFEADDVCGSVAASAEAAGRACVVATSDRDAFALVNDHTSVLRIRSGMHRAQRMDTTRFRREIGITPGQYTEYAALRGDTSDNLPGIHGVGPKRAKQLLNRYDTVAEAVADPMGCRSVLGPEVGQTLIDDLASPDSVFLRNIRLMTIHQHLDVAIDEGRPSTPVDQIEHTLRDRRLAGLIERMVLCFGDPTAGTTDQPPPLTDADAPPLLLEQEPV